jgi:hypothetical protein
MAKTDRFMIAPLNSGLQSDVRPWLIPDDAFQSLTNAYVFRGRVTKRVGSYLMNSSVNSDYAQLDSRVRINIGTTDSMTGNFSGTVPGTKFKVGQMFSVGTDMFTVYQTGTPADMLTTSATATGTFNTSNGAVSITGESISTIVYFYPATPIIGLITYEDDQLDNEPVFAFDTQFSYQYAGGAWQVLDNVLVGTANPAAIWTGTDSQLMWGYTYRGISASDYYLFVTNFNYPDRLRYWNKVSSTWSFLSPIVNNTTRLLTSRIVIPFKDRLVCLSTVENVGEGTNVGNSDGGGAISITTPFIGYTYTWGQTLVCGTTTYQIVKSGASYTVTVAQLAVGNSTPAITATFTVSGGNGTFSSSGDTYNKSLPVYYFPNTGGTPTNYINRCRFSQNGSPVAINAWEDNVAGLGGYVDAPTKEQIITCQFLKDRLVVYFESSAWELVYTGNEVLPFRWQKFNTELGVESTFSVVPFDKVAIGIGTVGIHACNGSNVERIDQKIPDDVFGISTQNNGAFRVYGIRDYFTEMVYWAIPTNEQLVYNNQILVYNYKTGSWAFNDDTVTAFGYYCKQDGLIWQNWNRTWEQSLEPWVSPTSNFSFREVLAGNQEGYLFIVDREITRNAAALQITNMVYSGGVTTITAINHNLIPQVDDNDPTDGDYIVVESAQGVTGINDNIYPVQSITDANTFVIDAVFTGTYKGGGTLARVSNIDIETKQYNFYADQGRNAAINKVDFLVDATVNGEVQINYSTSSATNQLVDDGMVTGAIVGNAVLETSPYQFVTREQNQARLWHTIYTQAEGECIQFNIYMNNNQIIQPDIAWSAFTLHAMLIHSTPTSDRLQ